jgi:tetratricopeptide (TPR) repeat protein
MTSPNGANSGINDPEVSNIEEMVEKSLNRGLAPFAGAKLMRSSGLMYFLQDRRKAFDCLSKAAGMFRWLDDRLELGATLAPLGACASYLGRYKEAEVTLDEAISLLKDSEHKQAYINALNERGALAVVLKRPEEAQQFLALAISEAEKMHDLRTARMISINLAETEFVAGHADRAVVRLRETADGLKTTENRAYYLAGIVNLTTYLIAEGNMVEARTVGLEALELSVNEGGSFPRLCLQQWALFAALDERLPVAARLIGYADSRLEHSGDLRQPVEVEIIFRVRKLVADGLSDEERIRHETEGAQMSEAEALHYAFNTFVKEH